MVRPLVEALAGRIDRDDVGVETPMPTRPLMSANLITPTLPLPAAPGLKTRLPPLPADPPLPPLPAVRVKAPPSPPAPTTIVDPPLPVVKEINDPTSALVAPSAPFDPITCNTPLGVAVPIPTLPSLALTTRVSESMLMPVLRVVVAVAEDGIWNMAVPASVRTLKTLPVNDPPGTSLMKSPAVMVEDE